MSIVPDMHKIVIIGAGPVGLETALYAVKAVDAD